MMLLWLACAHAPAESELRIAPEPESASADSAVPVDTGDPPPLAETITDPCTRAESGPDRDCGYTYRGLTGCILGTDVPYDFGPDPSLEQQALRICRTTSDGGIPCLYVDAIAQAVGRDVRFRCPRLVAGGAGEVGGNGGGFSIYTAEAWP